VIKEEDEIIYFEPQVKPRETITGVSRDAIGDIIFRRGTRIPFLVFFKKYAEVANTRNELISLIIDELKKINIYKSKKWVSHRLANQLYQLKSGKINLNIIPKYMRTTMVQEGSLI